MNEPCPLPLSPLRAADLYHTCVVVQDLAGSMEQLTRLAGYRWMPAVEHPTAVWTPAGETTVLLRMVYSLDEPLLELIEQVPGTTWMPSRGGAIHHIGYFVDDLVASSRALTEAGLPLETCGAGPTRPSGFAYHTTSAGLRIEVVNRSVLRDMRVLLAAPPVPPAPPAPPTSPAPPAPAAAPERPASPLSSADSQEAGA